MYNAGFESDIGQCQTLTGNPLWVNTVAIFGLRRFFDFTPE
nr:MAG TPA: hypothetical protein [Caudoviricetes sp.]